MTFKISSENSYPNGRPKFFVDFYVGNSIIDSVGWFNDYSAAHNYANKTLASS